MPGPLKAKTDRSGYPLKAFAFNQRGKQLQKPLKLLQHLGIHTTGPSGM